MRKWKHIRSLAGVVLSFAPVVFAGQAPGALTVLPSQSGLQAQASSPSGNASPTAFPHVEDEILVRFKPGASRSAMASDHASMRAQAVRSFRIVDRLQRVKLPPGISVDEALEIYRQRADVLYVEPNFIMELQATPNDPSFGDLWGLQNTGQVGGTPDADIDAPAAWDITTGSSNVVVAVIDTGVDYNHQDLSANMFRNNGDCNNNGVDDDGNGFVDDCYGTDTANNDSDPLDDIGHGTHVAGTIGAAGNNSVGVVGVNWNVRLMACKITKNFSIEVLLSAAIECLEYVKLMKDRGVNVVATNNSWSGPIFSQALFDATEAHLQKGILFITAAGNGDLFKIGQDNDTTPVYPCDYDLPNIICVAATTRTDARALFSNFGRRTVHLGAPGQEIRSTFPLNQYRELSGTSMATPHVTGVAALLAAQDPGRDWRAIKNLILAGGDSVSSMTNTISQKRLNAFGALTCSNSMLFTRLKPIRNTLIGAVGIPTDLTALHINCADPDGDVTVTVNPKGQVITLLDDGAGADYAAGDGIYSGQFTPPTTGTFTLTFSNGDVVTVDVPPPMLSVTPASQDFGAVMVGSSADRNFTVQNIGQTIISGKASTSAPFSIVAGGSYDLVPGQTQMVTVRFGPTSPGISAGNVTFTGGGGASKTVTGAGVTALANPPLPDAEAGVAYSAPLVTGGLSPYTINLVKGAFPRGLRADSTSGRIVGVPAPSKGGSFTVQVIDQLGSSVTRTIRMKIFPAPIVTTTALPVGRIGRTYSWSLKAMGGKAPLTWSLVSGTLPSGLSLDGATGMITGTPSAAGIADLTFEAIDPLGGSAQKTLTLTIR